MKRKVSRIMVLTMAVALVAFAAAIFAGPSLATKKATEMTITGTVIEMAKDKDGKVIKVGIKTDSEGEFSVVRKGKGAELLNMLDKKVEVTGAVYEAKGKKRIAVISYKVIETQQSPSETK